MLYFTKTLTQHNSSGLAGALTGGWWSSQDEQVRHKDDELSGEIFIASSNEASGSDSRMVLSRVSGSWLKGVEFTDGTDAAHCYWAREQTPTTAIDNTLPSSALPTDSRVRADITGLAAGTLDTAQEAKERIENVCLFFYRKNVPHQLTPTHTSGGRTSAVRADPVTSLS